MGIGNLLGGLLGADKEESGQDGAADSPLEGLLGGLVGGSQGGLGGMLGGLLGGADLAANPMVAGVVQNLAEQLGLPPQVAQTIVAFAMDKILPALTAQLQGQAAAKPASGGGFDVNDLLQRVGQGQPLGHDYLAASGMPQELAGQAGIDVPTAEKGLEGTFKLLGEQLLGGQGGGGVGGLLGGLGG